MKKKAQSRIRKKSARLRNPIAATHSRRGGAGAGFHSNKKYRQESLLGMFMDWQDELLRYDDCCDITARSTCTRGALYTCKE